MLYDFGPNFLWLLRKLKSSLLLFYEFVRGKTAAHTACSVLTENGTILKRLLFPEKAYRGGVGWGRCFISLGGWQNYDNLKRYNIVLMIIVRAWKCVFRRRRNVRISFINPLASGWCLIAGEIYRWGWFFIFGRIERCKFGEYCCNSHIISHEMDCWF